MTKQSNELALKIRERILDAALSVFHKSGVSAASLSAVAELAGVTPSALCNHFRDNVELLNALTERVRVPGEQLCETAGDQVKEDPLGVLRTRWLWLFHEIACNEQWQWVLEILFHRAEVVDEGNEPLRRLKQGHTEAFKNMGQLVHMAVTTGQLPVDLDVSLAAEMLHGGLFGVLEEWLLSSREEDLGERYIDSLLDMIRFSPAMRQNRPKQVCSLH
ncbi:TetR family transcriptional regulator [Microbulbifer sp. 2205BS26-8]|uniref:TetR family transcriptional regulator n=1 Tax=Microbulbifer sp. 2205BS26-8 TaxID=3064386 RepID=UPI00273F4E18|nr:TetR family transcriptional regulator [Microbulbifer sp. 2205BS26-8]MDP5210334.1 TetR family transcriptional regulator [Microbulbifer sp. 2205BS26-8]